jgi:hypothetical protein
MKLSRKIIGFAVATAIFATQFTTVMAADGTASDMGNGSTSGSDAVVVAAGNEGQGNILINSADKVVVPTALRFVLNPKGYEVIIRYNEVVGFDKNSATLTAASGVNYYLKKGTKYEKYDLATGAALNSKLPADFDSSYDGKVYSVTPEAGGTYVDTSRAQIISLNYGIMNKSTADKIVSASFKVSYSAKPNNEGTPVTFVGTAAEATYGNAANNAGKNDLNLFLQVQTPADDKDVKVRQTYTRATSTAPTFANTTVYYTYDGTTGYKIVPDGADATEGYDAADGKFTAQADLDAALKIFNGDIFVLENYNNAGMATTPDTTGSQLSDAVITGFVTAGDSPQTFVAPASPAATDAADASVTYELVQGTYVNRSGQLPDWNSQDLGSEVMYCSAAPGVTGFTFAGAMNSQVDWAKANTTALKITPRYTIRDLEDGEATEAVGDATNGKGLRQVVIASGPSVVTTPAAFFGSLTANTPASISVDLGTGSLAATSVSSVKWNGTELLGSAVTYNATAKTLTFAAGSVDYLLGGGSDRTYSIEFTLTGGGTKTVTFVVPNA